MTLINTRPTDRAEPLTRHLRQAGIDVLELPLLATQPRTLSDVDHHTLKQWHDYDVMVVVSPTAAKLFLQHLANFSTSTNAKTSLVKTSMSVQPPILVAVGHATADVLQQQGLQQQGYAIQIPTTHNNEGMLAMPCIAMLQAGQRVLICRGVGGRQLLIATLNTRGVQVDTVPLYQRQLPEQTQATFVNWVTADWVTQTHLPNDDRTEQTDALATVLISSGESFEHWQKICQNLSVWLQRWLQKQTHKPLQAHKPLNDKRLTDHANLSCYRYLALGNRLCAMLSEQQLNVTMLDSLEPQHILIQYQRLV